ncbi:MAG: UvrD-helicase domain-containing protein [Victivallales bacterium]|nr:UvrD-helicase domain-containing protein [Victivallales bacterium]
MDHDFNNEIYSPTFQVNQGAHLIEASAGTGKTYNIQNLYARFIMETDFKVANILVMTYTEAATKELRERLHTVLEDLQRCFAGIPCEGKSEREIHERAERAGKLIACPSDKASARQRVELALLEFDYAAISTIHGFCQRVLTRYAFETGMNLSQEIQNSKAADLRARVLDWWRTHKNIPLNNLQKYVLKLGDKTDYTILSDDPTLQVANDIVGKYEQERYERESLNFDDLLRALRDALKNKTYGKALADKLREEYKVALIDEFQDTDPVQYDIFKNIFLDKEHPCPVYFVGDPKQAIYAFRGGDIYTYFTAKNEGNLQEHFINANHRSIGRLVDVVNAMFHENAPGETFGDKTIAYHPSIAKAAPDKIKGTPLERPLRIIEFTPADDSPAKIKDMPAIIDRMTGQILDILNQRDAVGKRIFTPKDIAILMNAKSDMSTLQEKLLAKGIPCVIRNPGNVFGTPIAQRLKVFLEAIAEAGTSWPGANEHLRAALLTVFGGCSPQEVATLETPEDLTGHIEHFRELKNVWLTRGFVALSNRMEQEGYLQRLAQAPNGERLLSDIGQIMELCCAATKTIDSTPEALIDWLNERIRTSSASGEESDSEEYERELETDGEAVKILTIHASKGLQFPVVFLPDCWTICSRHDPRNQFPLPYYHDEMNQNQLVFAPGKPGKAKAEAELHLEKIRLLYVALTRAIQQTILFTPSLEALEKLNEPLKNLLRNLKDNSGDNPPYEWLKDTEVRMAEGYYTPDLPPETARNALDPRSFDRQPPVRGSYTSLAPGPGKNDFDASRDRDEVDSPLYDSDNEDVHPIFTIPAGARLGTCWHNILEKIPFDADEGKIRSVAEAELQNSGYKPAKTLDVTVKMVAETLRYPITSPEGKLFPLRDISWANRLSEQEFTFSSADASKTTSALREILLRHWANDPAKREFINAMNQWDRPIPQGFLLGFMDLVFRHDGFFYIIDWKSNSLGNDIANFTADGIRMEMAKHGYFFQYMLYAAVLHQYLKSRLGDSYSWERNFGGVRYFFLRGITAQSDAAVFEDRPAETLLDEFSRTLGMEVNG